MRILLFTGKGGVGKTTIAAATAVAGARSGRRVLVLSTDAAHSLADAFGCHVGAEPTAVTHGLEAEQVDAQRLFEDSWSDIQRYLLSVLDAAGMERVAAAELSVLPGVEEVMALLALRERLTSGRWDAVIVDCAPTAETLRLLALPDALRWYMERVFPFERRVVTALRPALQRATGVPMPRGDVFDAAEALYAELADVRALLGGPASTVRAVLTPERVVVAEARRAYTSLSLFGYRVDGVVANRVFPTDGDDPWRQGWAAAQAEVLDDVRASFAGLPLWTAAYRATEPVGVDALEETARAMYAGADPLATPEVAEPLRWETDASATVLRLALPGAASTDVDLGRRGGELVVTVGTYRRLVAVPAGLAQVPVASARVRDGDLVVRFAGREEDA